MTEIKIDNTGDGAWWLYNSHQGWKDYCGCENFDEQVVLTGNREFTGCMEAEWYQKAKEILDDIDYYDEYPTDVSDEVNAKLKEMYDKCRCTEDILVDVIRLLYPEDGLVITYDNVEYGKSLGNTGHHPRHSLAFKFYDEEEVTTLKDVEWGMGKTGQLTPVAIFDDVEIEGTTVNRASLHNVSILRELQLGIGDEITVYKSNQIIPQLRENLTKSNTIIIPSTCPICGEPTKIVKDNDSEVLYCTNDNCKGRLLGKLSHAVSRNALNIDGLSEASIGKFINLGFLNSIKDIYHLSEHEKELKSLDGFGKKSIDKLLESIEKSRNTTVDRFLYSLSIPLLGRSASGMISEAIDYDFGTFMKKMTIKGAEYFRYLPGVGDALIESLDSFFNKHCSDIFELSKEFTFEPKDVSISENSNISGKTFVVTGSVNHFSNRDELKKTIESYGGKVVGSVSKKTDYLLNNDINSTSSKNTKAKALGVKIITEEDFLKMMEG